MQKNVNATVGVFSKIMVNKNIHANKEFKCRDLETCPAPYSPPYLLSVVS